MRLTLGRLVGKFALSPSPLLSPPSPLLSPAYQWTPAAACTCWRELTSYDAEVSWHETQKRNADPGSDDPACCRTTKRIQLPVCISVCPSVRPSVCLYVCPSVRLSVCPSVYPSICLSVCPSICLSVCPSHYQLV